MCDVLLVNIIIIPSHLHVITWGEVEVAKSLIWCVLVHPRHLVQVLQLLGQPNTGTTVGRDVHTGNAKLTAQSRCLLMEGAKIYLCEIKIT